MRPYSQNVHPAPVKRLRAWLLLVTFVASLGLTGFSADHLGIIDIACGAVELPAGDREPLVRAASPGTAQHCPVCHFLQAVSGATATPVACITVPEGRSLQAASANLTTPVRPSVPWLSRGPPASSPSTLI